MQKRTNNTGFFADMIALFCGHVKKKTASFVNASFKKRYFS